MKRLFNGRCAKCDLFRPRCAQVVYFWKDENHQRVSKIVTLCDQCRKAHRGQYRVTPQHK